MGADHINVSELSKRESPERWIFLGSALITRLLWSIICFTVFMAFLLWIKPDNEAIYLLLSGLIPISTLAILGNKLQSDGRFFQYAVICCSAIFISAMIKITGILLSYSIEYFAVAAVFDSAILFLLFAGWTIINDNFNLSLIRPVWREVKRYFYLAFPTALSVALVAVYLRLELFIIDFVLGKAPAGLWAISMIFVTPWGMIAAAILPVANRWLAQHNANTDEYQVSFIKLIRSMLLLASIAIGLNLVAITVLVPLLFGDKFIQVKDVAWICSFAIIPLFMGSVQEIWIAQQRTTKVVLKKVLIGLPLSGVLLAVFSTNWGLAGVAVAMVISYFSTAVFLNILFDPKFYNIQLRALGIKHGYKH